MNECSNSSSQRFKEYRERKVIEYTEQVEEELKIYENMGYSRKESFILLLNRTLQHIYNE